VQSIKTELTRSRTKKHEIVNGSGRFTEEINNKTAITVSPRWYLEVNFPIRWSNAFNAGRHKVASVRIRVTKVENSRKLEVYGLC
jgi:hypothetical protein